MANYLIQDSTLTNIANSIRGKTGKSEPILTENMANEITKLITIPTGDTSFTDYIEGATSIINTTAQSIGSRAFASDQGSGGGKLTDISFTNAKSIGYVAFKWQSKLHSINFPNCVDIAAEAFEYCAALKSCSLPKVEKIFDYAFYKSGLQALTLNAKKVVTLGTDVFQGCPIDNGLGSIFVPASLIEQYKIDEKWTKYADLIKPIEVK